MILCTQAPQALLLLMPTYHPMLSKLFDVLQMQPKNGVSSLRHSDVLLTKSPLAFFEPTSMVKSERILDDVAPGYGLATHFVPNQQEFSHLSKVATARRPALFCDAAALPMEFRHVGGFYGDAICESLQDWQTQFIVLQPWPCWTFSTRYG